MITLNRANAIINLLEDIVRSACVLLIARALSWTYGIEYLGSSKALVRVIGLPGTNARSNTARKNRILKEQKSLNEKSRRNECEGPYLTHEIDVVAEHDDQRDGNEAAPVRKLARPKVELIAVLILFSSLAAGNLSTIATVTARVVETIERRESATYRDIGFVMVSNYSQGEQISFQWKSSFNVNMSSNQLGLGLNAGEISSELRCLDYVLSGRQTHQVLEGPTVCRMYTQILFANDSQFDTAASITAEIKSLLEDEESLISIVPDTGTEALSTVSRDKIELDKILQAVHGNVTDQGVIGEAQTTARILAALLQYARCRGGMFRLDSRFRSLYGTYSLEGVFAFSGEGELVSNLTETVAKRYFCANSSHASVLRLGDEEVELAGSSTVVKVDVIVRNSALFGILGVIMLSALVLASDYVLQMAAKSPNSAFTTFVRMSGDLAGVACCSEKVTTRLCGVGWSRNGSVLHARYGKGAIALSEEMVAEASETAGTEPQEIKA